MYQTHTPLPRAPRLSRPRLLAALLLLMAAGFMAGCARSPLALSPEVSPEAGPTQSLAQRARRSELRVHARTVRSLANPDFATRSRAARTLVEAGDAALPALGRAGDMPVNVDGGIQVSATRSVLEAVLACSEDERLPGHLESPWPNVRRAAAEELGHRDQWNGIPALIGHLEDADAEVRLASASSLRRITNNFFGYRAMASTGHRRATARRWSGWWSSEGRARTREPKVVGSARGD